jgi:hypothetical protein
MRSRERAVRLRFPLRDVGPLVAVLLQKSVKHGIGLAHERPLLRA